MAEQKQKLEKDQNILSKAFIKQYNKANLLTTQNQELEKKLTEAELQKNRMKETNLQMLMRLKLIGIDNYDFASSQ